MVVYGQADTNWSAYSPDVPGCIAVGDTREEVEANFRAALEIWLDEAGRAGLPLPQTRADVGRARVAA